MGDFLRVSLMQIDIVWENKQENLNRVGQRLQALAGATDVVVLPEMFSTGFSVESRHLTEPVSGETITTVKKWAADYKLAISGSFICSEKEEVYNRAFFITPDGEEYYYDKRHLFRMGNEARNFSSGSRRLLFNYRGWNICLMVCYDLRFPVWLRNVGNEYDLLLVVANWPFSRIEVWNTLLRARAIENQCYVCGVNRVGEDGQGLAHSGHSALLDARGTCLTHLKEGEEGVETVAVGLESLRVFRDKFPVWKDADEFHLDS